MLQVHITESPKYTTEKEIVVKLPKYRTFLVFDLDDDYFLDEISGNTPVERDFVDFICANYNSTNILNSSIRNGLTTLSYIFYMTTNSIDETVKRLNALELEEVIWSMICDDVIDKFRALYEE